MTKVVQLLASANMHVRLYNVGVSPTGKIIGELPPTANATRQLSAMGQARTTKFWLDLTVSSLLSQYPMLVPHLRPAFLTRKKLAAEKKIATSLKRTKTKVVVRPVVTRYMGPMYPQATILCIRNAWRRADYDGLVRSFKSIVDGVVLAGVVGDDSHTYVRTRYWSRSASQRDQSCEIFIWNGFVDVPPEEPTS